MVQPVTNADTTRHGAVTNCPPEGRKRQKRGAKTYIAAKKRKIRKISSFEIKIRITIKKPKKHQIEM
jgi:hypothetical protein